MPGRVSGGNSDRVSSSWLTPCIAHLRKFTFHIGRCGLRGGDGCSTTEGCKRKATAGKPVEDQAIELRIVNEHRVSGEIPVEIGRVIGRFGRLQCGRERGGKVSGCLDGLAYVPKIGFSKQDCRFAVKHPLNRSAKLYDSVAMQVRTFSLPPFEWYIHRAASGKIIALSHFTGSTFHTIPLGSGSRFRMGSETRPVMAA